MPAWARAKALQGGSEPAAGVGVTPRVGVHEHGGDGLAELTGVGGVPGPPGLPARGLGVHRAGGGGARVRVCFAVRPALATPRAGDRGLDCGEDIELLVEAGDAQDLGYRRRRRGQAQEPAEQPGAASGGHQYGEAAGVGVTAPRTGR